jgi:hypothetical protein
MGRKEYTATITLYFEDWLMIYCDYRIQMWGILLHNFDEKSQHHINFVEQLFEK